MDKDSKNNFDGKDKSKDKSNFFIALDEIMGG